MSRRGGLQQDNDSDEDQVLYLDHGQQPGEDNSTTLQSRGSAKEKKLPKFKALFQHKKYKGGLEDEKYDVDSSPGFSWPVAPLEKKDKETDSSQQDDLNFGKFTSKANEHSDLATAFHEEQVEAYGYDASPGYPVAHSSRPTVSAVTPRSANKNAPASNRSTTAAFSAVAQGGNSSGVSTTNRGLLDVAGDRPAHWNSRRPAVARSSRSDGKTNKSSVIKSTGALSKPKMVQMPKPKPLPHPTQQAAVAPALAVDALKLSFKPSWMASVVSSTSSDAHQGSQGVHGRQSAGRSSAAASSAAVASALATEDIQEDAASPVRRTTGPSYGAGSSGGSGGMLNQNMSSFGSPAPHSLSFHSGGGGGGMVSPCGDYGGYTATGGGGGSGTSAAHFTSSGSRSSAKAKPGTLKAKLQKLFRDLDAAENRLINVPVDPNSRSRAVDLQDPRQRAVSHVDAEVTQILPDQVPFRVIQLCVTNTWQKETATAAATADTTQMNAGGDESCKPNVGELIVGFFKPDTCVGASRTLAEGMVMRVYDPHFLCRNSASTSPRTRIGSSGGGDGEGSAVFGEDDSVLCAMINTNCWEPIGEVP